ncbi:MAG: efflux RND transporter periplasmic adaptor subunit [Cyanobacteriota bacterium]|nr:efflux RND transporter periplasmic adaptor subunit [Cyanobacteriota bacterium]
MGLATCVLVVLTFRPTPILVDTKLVERGTLQVTVNAEGKTRIKEDFVISATVSGRLDRIKLDEGDSVKKGNVVASIDPLPLNTAVKEALGKLAEAKAQRQGVTTLRPKSEKLAQIRSRISAVQAKQLQAEARVAQARAALAQAKRDTLRAQELAAKGAIPRQDKERAELNQTTREKELESAVLAATSVAKEVEAAQAELKVLQKEQRDPDYLLKVYDAQIASIEAQLSKLQDDASRTNIYSPIDGKVLRILQKSSNFISEGTPLIKVGNPKDLELVIDVLSRDALNIKPGNTILIEKGNNNIDNSAQNSLKAEVRLIEPSAFTKISALGVEEQRVNVIADFVDSASFFGDAYRVDVQIVVWEGKNVLKVPLSSIFRCNGNWCVFVMEDGKAHRKTVKIGNRSNYEVEIAKGLNKNEIVILYPSEQIEAGTSVKAR